MSSLGDEPIMKECQFDARGLNTNKYVRYIVEAANDSEHTNVNVVDIETGDLIIEGYFLLEDCKGYDDEELDGITTNVQLIRFLNWAKDDIWWLESDYQIMIDLDGGLTYVTFCLYTLVFVYILKLIYI
jgi:hypothetical protein